MTREKVIDTIKQRLTQAEIRQFELEVFEPGVRKDDDWWYVPVSTKKERVSAFDYAPLLSKIEEEFEEKFQDEGTRLLLIPALEG
jgi:hypothetical protein